MLTKDLLNYQLRKGVFVPGKIKVKDEANLGASAALIAYLENSIGENLSQIEAEFKTIRAAFEVSEFHMRGFEKLLLDRCEFGAGSDSDGPEFRRKAFEQSQLLLQQADLNDSEMSAAERIAAQLNLSPEQLMSHLYNDLPAFQKLVKFDKITSEELLQRYNCAQIQGLLMRSSVLKIALPKWNTGELRRLLKALRFARLVVQVCKKENGSCELNVSGPLSLLMETRAYGIQLAVFFPHLLQLPEWALEAQVEFEHGRTGKLVLDNTCEIKLPLSHFNSYVPEELQMFQEAFGKKESGWKISEAQDFLPFVGEQLCFPDFEFENAKKKKIYLEVFHRWHFSALEHRIKQLESQPAPLILAVSRKLFKDEALFKEWSANKTVAKHVFFFREMPLVRDALQALSLFKID